jgi:hypothetical protein
MTTRFWPLALLIAACLLPACDAFVQDVDLPKDTAGSSQLNDDSEAQFLIRGVQAQWADATDNTLTAADFLSDQFRFGRNADATFPTFVELDTGRPQSNNNSVVGAANALGQYRFLADSLVGRADVITFTDEATASKAEMKYAGYLHGAIARYLYATYFGRAPREGGGVLDTSAFIPAPAMYERADRKFAQALVWADKLKDRDDQEQRIVQSLRARAALFAGTHNFSASGGLQGSEALRAAVDYAAEGLRRGDPPYEVKYSAQDNNNYADEAGPARTQMAVQDGYLLNPAVVATGAYKTGASPSDPAVRSFADVVAANPKELARVPMGQVLQFGTVGATLTPDNAAGLVGSFITGATQDPPFSQAPFDDPEAPPFAFEFVQTKYREPDPIPFLSWQEVYLMRAELELRGYSTGSMSAQQLLNAVRDSYADPMVSEVPGGVEFDPLSSGEVTLNRVAVERDRTLFGQGLRLPDQRRLAQPAAEWHLRETAQGGTTWQWLPISRQERDNNPNL